MFADTLRSGRRLLVTSMKSAMSILPVPGNRDGLAEAGRRCRPGHRHGVHRGRYPRRGAPCRARYPAAAYLAALGPGLQACRAGDRGGGRAGRVSRRAPARAAVALAGLVRRRRAGLPVPRKCTEPCLQREPAGSAGTARSAWQARYGSRRRRAQRRRGLCLRWRAAAGAIAGLVIRWRRGGPLLRQQLLLLALATWPPALVFLAILISDGRFPAGSSRGAAAAACRDRGRDPPSRPV